MDCIYVAVTAVTVSLDSLIAGFSLSINKKGGLTLPLTVALVTYLLCLVSGLAAVVVKDVFGNYVKYVGIAILFCLGVAALVKEEEFSLKQLSFAQCLATGFGVGLDGAAANLSLVLQGTGSPFVLPIVFAATHFVAVCLGQKMGTSSQTKGANVLSAVALWVLALSKLLWD